MAIIDDFNRADETLETSSNWVLQDGTAGSLRVVSNGLNIQNKDAWYSYRYVTDQGPDCYVSAKRLFFASVSGGVDGLALRVVDKDNWIAHTFGGTGAAGRRLSKCVSGTITDLITSQGVSGEWIKVEADGNTVKLFEGGTGATPTWTQLGSDQTVTDHNTEASVGFAGYSSGYYAFWDDFESDSLSAGATITLASDTITLAESTLTIQANVNTNVTLSADSITLAESQLTITTTSEVVVNLTPDTLTLTEGTLSVQADVDTNITLGSDALTLTESQLSITIGLGITPIADSIILSESTLTVQANVDSNISLTADSLTLAESTLVIDAIVPLYITTIPDAISISESILTIDSTTINTDTWTLQAQNSDAWSVVGNSTDSWTEIPSNRSSLI